jgi:hypothetical protein
MERIKQACAAAALVVALLLVAGALPNAGRTHAGAGCASTIDLMLVVDGSESISREQFDTMQLFMSNLVAAFTIGPDDGHAGIVQFASQGQGRVEIALSGDGGAVQAAIAGMEQIIGVTDIQEGIALGQGQLDASGRAGVPQVLILVTDGEHNQPGDPNAEAEAARNAGTEIFAIAIGQGPKLAQLNGIVSPPADGHTVSVDDFDGLVAVLEPLVAVVCPPTPTPSPAATPAPPGDGSVPPGSLPGPDDSDSAGPVDEVLGVTRLPVVGAGLPPELDERGGDLLAQALGGLGGALTLLAATYWVARWRVRH